MTPFYFQLFTETVNIHNAPKNIQVQWKKPKLLQTNKVKSLERLRQPSKLDDPSSRLGTKNIPVFDEAPTEPFFSFRRERC